MPFDDEDPNGEIISKKNVGVKLNNSKSMVNSLPKKPSKDEFVKKATEVNETLNTYTLRAADLASKFKKVLEDKNLVQNKSLFALEAERDLLSNLVQLAVDMNNDQHEQEGMGAVGLITLLLRTALIQRDKINQLEYNYSLLEKRIRDINQVVLTPKDK
jgi:hypothetical protein